MPRKAYERYIFHVMAYAIFKCPKIEEFYFRSLFFFKIDHVFFLNAPFFLFESENRVFQKIGHEKVR